MKKVISLMLVPLLFVITGCDPTDVDHTPDQPNTTEELTLEEIFENTFAQDSYYFESSSTHAESGITSVNKISYTKEGSLFIFNELEYQTVTSEYDYLILNVEDDSLPIYTDDLSIEFFMYTLFNIDLSLFTKDGDNFVLDKDNDDVRRNFVVEVENDLVVSYSYEIYSGDELNRSITYTFSNFNSVSIEHSTIYDLTKLDQAVSVLQEDVRYSSFMDDLEFFSIYFNISCTEIDCVIDNGGINYDYEILHDLIIKDETVYTLSEFASLPNNNITVEILEAIKIIHTEYYKEKTDVN